MSVTIFNLPDCSAANTSGVKHRRRQTAPWFPDEILEIVLLEEVLDEQNLCALALVNRRFNRLAEVSLYNEVSIPLLEVKHKRFTRTLSRRPELGSYVWRAGLSGRTHDKEECFRAAQHLLRLLPALSSLTLKIRQVSDESTSLFNQPMPHLRDISFSSDGRLMQGLAKIISFPQITRLSISFHKYEIQSKHVSTALDALAGTSSIKDLTLHGWLDSTILGCSSFKVPRELEILRCHFDYSRQFTPQGTVDALRPVYLTLVSLELGYFKYRVNLSGPVADFSCFVCLKNLTVDESICLERWSAEVTDERRGFSSRLPSTLESLNIIFCSERGRLKTPCLELQLRTSYTWILELARHKSAKFKDLRNVTLLDNLVGDGKLWEYPKTLLRAFKSAEVELVVQPRVSDYRRCTCCT